MKHFAVIGHPISHSKSPDIHQSFAQQFEIDLTYKKILAEVDAFILNATQFLERGNGMNVTVPFKENALIFSDELSDEAELAGAVNTLSRKNGLIYGDNTDGMGLVRDIKANHQYDFSGKKILIIGAGGASRGVILPILRENPSELVIVNRSIEKAVALARKFAPYGNIKSQILEGLTGTFDLIINATSVSLSGQSLPISSELFHKKSLGYDMMYGASPSAFMQLAKKSGATGVDGLGMLVEQAAESFFIWHGVKPDTKHIISMMREQL